MALGLFFLFKKFLFIILFIKNYLPYLYKINKMAAHTYEEILDGLQKRK